MTLRIYNTLTKKVEDFAPLDNQNIRFYSCGPTVYGYAHIGNFRTFIFNDLLRRYLKYKGYKVHHVMNITDIDDKTIRNSQAEGVSLKEFTDRFTAIFFEDLDFLNIEKTEHYPRATDYIPQMVQFIEGLQKKGIAYESDGSIYFKIASFQPYGQLSNIDPTQIKSGLRYDTDEYEKEDIRDFALWKKAEANEPFWEAPFGKGRPGWHLECSVMSRELLGETIDIHTGGVDLIFPHHENEIAQSEALSGKKFVRFWIHAEHLLVDNRKMSKSLGNQYNLRDLMDKGYSGREIRFLLLGAHYRKKLNFTIEGLDAARNSLKRIDSLLRRLLDSMKSSEHISFPKTEQENFLNKFSQALDDDLNISEALGHFFDWLHSLNSDLEMGENKLPVKDRNESGDKTSSAEVLSALEKIDRVLGFVFADKFARGEKKEIRTAEKNPALAGLPWNEKEIEGLLEERNQRRKNKDFSGADQIRDLLKSNGIMIEDTPKGSRWYKA
jgi:cysteinyl-tRNA synthetase